MGDKPGGDFGGRTESTGKVGGVCGGGVGQAEAVGKVRDGRWGKEEEGERGLCGRVEVRRKGEVKGTMGGGGGVSGT